MPSKGTLKSWAFKSVVLLSLTRWYNVLLTAVAQYIAAFFIFNQWHSRIQILQDVTLHLIVLCTTIFIAAGYIINFFYDKEVDLINYPKRTKLFLLLNKDFLLKVYFILVLIGLSIATFASIKIGLFFFVFSFMIWFYSHKLKRIPYVRELVATVLTIASFFSITLHYGKISYEMFLYGWFIFFIILIREGFKDQEQVKGNAIYSYYSLSIINNSKRFLTLINVLAAVALMPLLLFYLQDNYSQRTFIIMVIIWMILLFAVLILHKKLNVKYVSMANNLLKLAIVLSMVGLFWLNS